VLGVVEFLALVAPIVTWSPISRSQCVIGLFLVSLSVVYHLCVIGWETARRHLLYERMPTIVLNVQAIWCFAAAMLLPPTAAAGVTLLSAVAGWRAYNSVGASRRYRHIFTVSTAVLAATVSSWVFRLSLPVDSKVVLASAGWILVGAGATTMAMCASSDFDAARKMLHPRTHSFAAVTMGVAVAEYFASVVALPFIWLSLPAAVAIQRYFVNVELRNREPAARPFAAEAWLQIATVIIEAADATTVLRIDTEDPRAAGAVAMMQGGCDAIGHYPDGGLAVLLLDCPPAQGDALARRLRLALRHHKIEAYVAAASAPRDGRTVQQLLTLCEAELVLMRAAARRPTSA
jgi:hypothetical protein